jgi:hypothetical protein
VPGPDYLSILAKLKRATQHAEWFCRVIDDFFGDPNKFELIFEMDRQAREVDVLGRFVERPPLAYLGAVYGDILNCSRSALDHLVWALSVRHQAAIGGQPPPNPIGWGSPWKTIGFPIVTDEANWKGTALTKKLALVDPGLHSRFRDLQPFVTDPATPKQAWLAMLDGLWNTDKHRLVHIANLTVALEHLAVTRRSNGAPIRFTMGSLGPRGYTDSTYDAEAHLLRLGMLEPWPESTDEVEVERGVRVNLFLDPDVPGFAKNMDFAQRHMHNTAVLAIHAFEAEFA